MRIVQRLVSRGRATPNTLSALPSYRTILRRVALAALGLAVAIGAVVFSIEVEIIDGRITAMATQQSKAFLHQQKPALRGEMSAETLSRSLEHFMSTQSEDEGRFIIAEFYGKDRRKLAEHVVAGADVIEDALRKYTHEFPEEGTVWYKRHLIDGSLFIQTMIPLSVWGGGSDAYFESVYQLPPGHSQELIRDTMTVVAASVLSAIGAALVLLPIFAVFNRSVMQLSGTLLHSNIDMLSVLGGTIAKRDSDTSAHNFRVTILSIRAAEALGLDERLIRSLIKGAFLHDVGKIGIVDSILLKPGKLDEAEFAVMKTHVAHGIDIISRSAWLADAKDVVACHHEKFDGSGYPAGLAGEGIPINARIFALADVFDALVSRRPYKEPMDYQAAMAVLEAGRGRHFDPAVLDVFSRIAKSLHQTLHVREECDVEAEMRALVFHYFEAS